MIDNQRVTWTAFAFLAMFSDIFNGIAGYSREIWRENYICLKKEVRMV